MGGVGSWAAEALARSGVGALTLVDLDVVCVTNVNRQVLATDASVGASKADTMAARVRDINPLCDVTIVRDFVSEANVEAILGLESLLVIAATTTPARLTSSSTPSTPRRTRPPSSRAASTIACP